MPVFSEVAARTPPRVIDLPVNAWSDDWEGKPTGPVKVGLRLLSEEDLITARATAMDLARDAHSDAVGRIEAFNDHLMAWAVARSLCRSDDVSEPYLEAAHENVQIAFTSRGIQRLWEEIEVLHIELSALVAEATDDELAQLAASVTPERLGDLSATKQARVRRLVTYLLDEIHG